MTPSTTKRPRRVSVISALIGIAFVAVTMSLGSVLAEGIPHLRAGTLPDIPYGRNYVLHPWPAALHIVPGLVYLFLAPLQLSARFRRKHLVLHRRLGRVLIACGIFTAALALAIGLSHPFDGLAEASATVVFSIWFVACLTIAFAAIRRRDVAKHRRWMIRAFAAGIGIGAIRVWVVILGTVQTIATGEMVLAPQRGTFGPAFWLGFVSTVAIGEWWLRTPAKPAVPPITPG